MNEALVDVEGASKRPTGEDQPDRSGLGITSIVAAIALSLGVLAAVGWRQSTSAPTDDVNEIDATEEPLPQNQSTTSPPEIDEALSTTDQEQADEVAALPVLNVDTGLEIWVGGDGRITRIDLDSGRRFQVDRRGYPLVVSGQWLVFFDARTDTFERVDRVDPSQGETRLDAGEDFTIDAIAESPVDNSVWVADATGDLVAWRLLSLGTGAPLRSATTSSLELMAIADAADLASGPEIDIRQNVTTGESEVWRLDGSEHVFWFAGSVVARDTTIALVENCDGSCTLEWRDLATGEQIERLVPPNLLDLNELLGGGTWIYARSEDLSASTFIDAISFEELDTKTRRRTRPFDIEDSGRWAAMTGSQRVWIVELETGEETPLPGQRSLVGTTASVVFAPAVE